MRATAIVPVKRFGAAKQRLAGELYIEQRALLATAMLDDVLAALRRAAQIERVLVVTGEPAAAAIAERRGVEVIGDPDDRGHSEAASIGIEAAAAAGSECAVLLPGDCPLLDAGELDRLLAGFDPPGVAVIPDRHGTGTNGLVLSPLEAIAPSFGPDSCERHLRLARVAGVPGSVASTDSLDLDLDTGEDLQMLRELLGRDAERAPATAVALRLLATEGPSRGGSRTAEASS
jgi:2-phospho-L-lactate guanylyltransferase